MAVTGLIGVGFVVAHMIGNLQAFLGRDKINAYSALLHGPLAEVILAMRVVLVVAIVLHVLMAWQLTRQAHAARPIKYHEREPQVSTWSARTMRWGGVFLLAFIAFHLMHLTLRSVDPGHWASRFDSAGRYDIYGNMVASFRVPWVSAVYLIAMVFMGLHLWHGGWSFARTLGLAPRSDEPMKSPAAAALAFVVWLGFSLIPIAIATGIIK